MFKIKYLGILCAASAAQAAEPAWPTRPEEFMQQTLVEVEKWKRVAKNAGVKAQ